MTTPAELARAALDNADHLDDLPPNDRPTGQPLSGVLSQVATFVRRYVVVTAEQLVAVVLWVAHAHAIEAAETTPYIDVSSPVLECGKTRLLETTEPLLPRVLRTGNISDAALFRTVADVEAGRAVILLDEADAIFSARSDREDLRALLNGGYRRGATVARVEMVGKAGVVRHYDAFGAKAIAGIGQRPETIRSRSIPIVMHRRARNEQVERFRVRTVRAEADPLRDALMAWAATPGVLERLAGARPDVPEALTDRQQDAWEPLLAIADEAGADWPRRARAAAVVLHGGRVTDEALGELLLAHLRELFADRDRMPTAEILQGLIDRDDGPWPAWWANDVESGRTRGPASKLARLLRPFGVDPRVIKVPDGTTARGYLAADLADAWGRYAHPAHFRRNDVTAQVDGPFPTVEGSSPLRPNMAPDQPRYVVTSENGQEATERVPGEVEIEPEPEEGLSADEAQRFLRNWNREALEWARTHPPWKGWPALEEAAT